MISLRAYVACCVLVSTFAACFTALPAQNAEAFNRHSSYRGVLPLNSEQLKQLLENSRVLRLSFDRREKGLTIYTTSMPEVGKQPWSEEVAARHLREVRIPTEYLSGREFTGKQVYTLLRREAGLEAEHIKFTIEKSLLEASGVELLPLTGKELKKLFLHPDIGFKERLISKSNLKTMGITVGSSEELSKVTLSFFDGVVRFWRHFRDGDRHRVLIRASRKTKQKDIIPLEDRRHSLYSSQLVDIEEQFWLMRRAAKTGLTTTNQSLNTLTLKYVKRYRK